MSPLLRMWPLHALSGAYAHRTAAREEHPLCFDTTDFDAVDATDVRHHEETPR